MFNYGTEWSLEHFEHSLSISYIYIFIKEVYGSY